MKTFTSKDEAADLMRGRNRRALGAKTQDFWVVVDGPGEGEATVMALGEAIEHGFTYAWER